MPSIDSRPQDCVFPDAEKAPSIARATEALGSFSGETSVRASKVGRRYRGHSGTAPSPAAISLTAGSERRFFG